MARSILANPTERAGLERTPGVCLNIAGCHQARSGRALLIALDSPFECPECGSLLRPPVLPDRGANRFVPALAGAALLLVAAGTLLAWHETQKQRVTASAAAALAAPGAPLPRPQRSVAPGVSDPGRGSAAPSAQDMRAAGRTPKPQAPAASPAAAGRPPAAAEDDRPFSPRPLGGEAPYPASLAADGRPGRVWVRCLILRDGKPRDCKARPERGGQLFADAVLAWLRNDAVFSPIIRNGHEVEEMHAWQMTIAETASALRKAKQAAQQVQSMQQPSSPEKTTGSSDPAYPKIYVGTGKRGSVSVDCLIGTDGHAADCHTLQSSGGPEFVDAVMNWLGKPETHFRPTQENGKNVAARRRLDVQFTP
jgi:outer membrane biosynthesis protein TonB